MKLFLIQRVGGNISYRSCQIAKKQIFHETTRTCERKLPSSKGTNITIAYTCKGADSPGRLCRRQGFFFSPIRSTFEKVSENLYEELLCEWSRVLKDSGRMVLLLNMSNLPAMTAATKKANCQIEFCRSPPFRLGMIKATILIISKQSHAVQAEGHSRVGKLYWETESGSGR
eukprot:scaffold4347_cov117-Cylindrotheca_fusiformis.AAC.9